MSIKVNKKAPNFLLFDQNNNKIDLYKLKSNLVLFFYPKDNTPGCTKEAISFLVCNFKGIEKHMAEQFYTIQVCARVITEDLLNFRSQDDIKIIPVVHGNFLQILLGA